VTRPNEAGARRRSTVTARVLAQLGLLGALFAGTGPAWAGPWVPGRWHFYLELREALELADARYDAAGARQPIVAVTADGTRSSASYRRASTTLYAEVGVAQRLSVLTAFGALDAVTQPIRGAQARSAVGVGDLLLGGKLLLFDDEITAALQVAVIAPTGSATGELPLGPGDLRADFLLLLGRAFYRPNLYLACEIGARLRGTSVIADPTQPGQLTRVTYAHEVRYAAQAGYTWTFERRALRSLGVVAKLEGSYALGPATDDGLGLLNPLAGAFFKLGPELRWSPERRLALSLGGHYFVAGRAMPAFAEVAVAIGYAR
jgi:hypothetical protein